MNDKDKILLKDSGLVVAEAVIGEIAKNFPVINIAWGLSHALYGAGLKLRQDKVLEWVEMIRDNPDYFTESVLSDEKFQDGFVYMLECFIRERNEERREAMKKIFLGFTKSDDKENFPIEKFTHTLSQLSTKDIMVMVDIDVEKASGVNPNYQVYPNSSVSDVSIHNLINLGILLDDNTSRLGPIGSPFVRISEFGKEFIQFIKE